jgi:DNA ligase (NAD+)
MKNLEALINQARIAYYNGKPFMSDELYDRMELQLDTLYDSVGSVVDPRSIRWTHAFPMYSLQKAYTVEESPNYGQEPVVVTPKLDGAAVALQYIRGKLSVALTRGDGKEGLDITDKMRHLVPQILLPCTDKPLVQITGEVVADKNIENSRNYAAGALNLKDINEFIDRSKFMEFIAYGVQPYPTNDYIEDMNFLNSCGFETSIDSNYAMFPQDGDVWRVISNKAFEKLGYTSHHPRGAFAKKTRPTGVVTKLLDVIWQVGKSGNVSPVAVLEPVDINGATVSRATLHNIAIIEGLGLEIGCSVEVIRAGEIIPQVIARVD